MRPLIPTGSIRLPYTLLFLYPRLEGAASLLRMLEDKADSEQITASELSAVRCIVEACASDLDAVLEQA